MTVKQIKSAIQELRQEMKAKGIKKTACFNGGLGDEAYQLNARLFRLSVELENAKVREGIALVEYVRTDLGG